MCGIRTEIYPFFDQKRGSRENTHILFQNFETNIYRIAEQEVHLLGWNVPAEDLHTIPEHWLSQYEPPASMHYLLGLLYIAFTILALTGNGLVIWVFSS